MTLPTLTSTAFTLDQMQSLYRLGKLVRARLDLQETLGAVADAACELTRAQLCAVMLLDDADHLVLRVGRGALATTVGERVLASAGIAGRALREAKTVLVSDLQAEPAAIRRAQGMGSSLRAYLAAPLIWEGVALGVVSVAASAPDAFDACDADLISELAEHAAAAVAHAQAFTGEQDQRAGTACLIRRLTERTAQLERVQAQMVQSEKLTAIGQLAHGIAHELNTPLGVIVSNLSVLDEYGATLAEFLRIADAAVTRLQHDEPPATVVESLEAAAQSAELSYILEDLPQLTTESSASAERIATIVRSLATFARQSSDKLAPVNVEEAIETAITLAWNDLKQRGKVVRNFGGVPPVIGQLSELAQVFVHLLLNASQSLEERQGSITLATSLEGDEVVVKVGDDGCGISRDNLPRVFDPFFTTREPGQGTGMGLSVCHGIVTGLGGSIALESELGRGTTVTVRLPLAEPAFLEGV